MAKGANSDLNPQAPYREAMRSLIATRFAAVWKAVPVAAEGKDPEGVHDVRVASRRLRAAMDVAVGCFPDNWYKRLHATAKEITTELGAVRDRDVLIEFLTKEKERVPAKERVGIDRLIARVTRERDEAREHMLAFLSQLEAEDVKEESIRRFGVDIMAKSDSEGS
jgi:CHAD domain-containing protein